MTHVTHRDLMKLLQANACNFAIWDVFRDFVELAALAIANRVDIHQAEVREARYLSIIQRYQPDEQKRFPAMFALLVEAMHTQCSDVMGTIMGELDLGNAARGQFFTPYSVCKMMAGMQVGDGALIRAEIERKGFITVSEPAVGGGAMVLAFAEAMREAGINYQQHMHVTAVDVDPRAVHMAFVQFSLLHIPATIILGNTLTLEVHEQWHTPAHFIGLWEGRLRRGFAYGSRMDVDSCIAATDTPSQATLAGGGVAQGDLFGQLELAA